MLVGHFFLLYQDRFVHPDSQETHLTSESVIGMCVGKLKVGPVMWLANMIVDNWCEKTSGAQTTVFFLISPEYFRRILWA